MIPWLDGELPSLPAEGLIEQSLKSSCNVFAIKNLPNTENVIYLATDTQAREDHYEAIALPGEWGVLVKAKAFNRVYLYNKGIDTLNGVKSIEYASQDIGGLFESLVGRPKLWTPAPFYKHTTSFALGTPGTTQNSAVVYPPANVEKDQIYTLSVHNASSDALELRLLYAENVGGGIQAAAIGGAGAYRTLTANYFEIFDLPEPFLRGDYGLLNVMTTGTITSNPANVYFQIRKK